MRPGNPSAVRGAAQRCVGGNRNHSRATVASYESVLRKVSPTGQRPLQQDVEAAMARIRGRSAGVQQRRLARAVQRAWGIAVSVPVEGDAAESAGGFVAAAAAAPIPGDAELQRLSEHCHTEIEKSMLALLLTTGVRIGALSRLRYDDIHPVAPPAPVVAVAHVTEKGGRLHALPLSAAVLRQVLGGGAGSSPFVFPAKRDCQRPMNIRCLREVFYRVARRAGQHRLHPHVIRHAVAHRLFALNNSVAMISKFLGHRSPQTTLGHYLNLSTQELVAGMCIPWLQRDADGAA